MKKYFTYILAHYTRSFLMILMAISVAITLIDYLQHSDDLGGFSNQTILYLTNIWMHSISQFYPLAIVFASVVTYMALVSSNTLVSMLSFGYTKQKLFLPFVLPSLLFYAGMIYLQLGEFSYAKERASAILHSKNSNTTVNDMLFTYNDNFVYVGKLDPVEKVLNDVTLFDIKNTEVQRITSIKEARYDAPFWIAKKAVITEKIYNSSSELSGFTKENIRNYRFLKDYKPKVIELIYEGEILSIQDAYNAYKLLEKQKLDSSKVKASLYYKVITPLFAFAMIALVFFKTSYYARYMNKELVWAVALGGTLVVWGIFYALFNVAKTGAVSAEFAILAPILIFLLYAMYEFFVADKKLA